MELDIHIPDWATHIVSDLTDMDRNPHEVDQEKVSSFSLSLPDDVYFEYAFLDAEGDMKADPENEVRGHNIWYPEVSAVYGPEYEADPYAETEEVEAGETQRERLESDLLEQTRRLSLYTPKGYDDEALPVVYIQDGTAFYRFAKVHLALEKLIERDLIRPAHLVFIEPKDRAKEYGYNETYRRFVFEEVIPFVEDKLETTDERVSMGASLGGLVSTLLAWDKPEVFGTVVAFSGAYMGTPESKDFYWDEDAWFLETLRREEVKPIRFYNDVGTLEWLTDINKEVAQVMDEKGYDHAFETRNAGHNWVNWRNGFRGALEFALKP